MMVAVRTRGRAMDSGIAVVELEEMRGHKV